MIRASAFAGTLTIALTALPASAETIIRGTVERVVDGDTFYVEALDHSLRPRGLDAPEADQPYGDAATAALRDLIAGERIEAVVHCTGPWDRPIVTACTLDNDGERDVNVNLWLVRQGHAWA